MNYLVAILLIPSGVYVLVRWQEVAARSARLNQQFAQMHPFWGRGRLKSEKVWRFITPVGGIVMIAIGIVMILFVPSS